MLLINKSAIYAPSLSDTCTHTLSETQFKYLKKLNCIQWLSMWGYTVIFLISFKITIHVIRKLLIRDKTT